MANNDIPVFVKILGDTKDVSSQLGKVQKDIKSWVGNVEAAGFKAGASFGVFGAALSAVTAGAVKAASGFEDMQTRLQAVTRDGEKAAQVFQQAVTLSAATPFPVGQMVQAATVLTTFRQNVQQTLPKVADFAAAMGTDVTDAAKLVGKALEGNQKAFRALANQADISANDLKQFGAVLDKNGKVALDNQVNIDRARNALQQLMTARYSGAAAAQAQTLTGSITKLHDALEQAAASFGKTLVPAATAGIQFVTGLVEKLASVPDWMKALATAATIGAGGLSVLGAGALVVGSQVLGMAANLSALALRFPAIGAAAASVSATLSGALAPAIAAVGTALTVAAPYIAAFTAAWVAGELVLYNYKHAIEELDAAVNKQAKSLANASGTAQNFAALINSAAGSQLVQLGGNLAETEQQVKKAFSTTPPEKMVAALEKAGITLDGLRYKLDENRRGAEAAQQRYQALAAAIISAEGRPDKGEEGVAVPEGLENLFNGNSLAGLAEARRQLQGLDVELKRFSQGKIEIEAMAKALESFQTPLVKATEEAKELQTYLKFADKARDPQTMTALTKTLTEEVAKLSAAANQQGLPADRAGLTKQLLTAQGTRKAFIEEYIKKLDEQEAAQKRLDEYTLNSQKEIITELERRHERELALSDPATTAKGKLIELANEKKFLEEKLALVKGANDKELELEKQLREAKGTQREAYFQERLKEQRQLADEETKTQSKLRANKRSTVEVKVTSARNDFEEQNRAALAAIQEQKDTAGHSAQDIVNSYQGVLNKLEAWKKAHRDLIAQSDELGKTVQATTRQIQAEMLRAQAAVKTENLTSLKTGTADALAQEANVRNKILLVNQAIAVLEKAIRMDVVGRKEGEAEVNALKKQGLDLARQEAQIQARDKLQGLNEDRQALDQEIAILEQRKAAGQDVEFTLMQMRKQRLQSALDAINLEAQAEIAAGRNREAVEHTRAAKVGSLLREEYLKQLQQWNETERAAQEHEDKLNAIKSNRQGGKHSPLMSMDEAFNKGGLGSDFSLDVDLYSKRRDAVAPPTVGQVAAQMGLDTKGQEAAKTALGAAAPGNGAAAPSIINVHINAEIVPPDVNELSKQLGKKLAEMGRQKALRVGDGAPDMTRDSSIYTDR